METSISINFSDKDLIEGLQDLLVIEQEEWVNTTGKVKKSALYNFTYNLLYNGEATNSVDCGSGS
jgi:hypothetical protein